MPRRALRCIVDLQLNLVSAPGVWLPCKEDLYLSVSFMGQYRNTRLITSVFPMLIHEKFRFEKTYYTAVDPAHVADMLADELVIFELVQLSEFSDGACRLASYSTNARDFLYPYPTLAPSYSSHDREVLMCRTVAFPGISPKLEFSTVTVIKESYSPELDAIDDAVEAERDARSRSRARRRVVTRSRSLSPVRRKLADCNLEDTIDPRPPFVVRKLSTDLIGRKPGNVTDKGAESKPKRSASPYRSPSRLAESRKSTTSSCKMCVGLTGHCSFCKLCQKYLGVPYWLHARCKAALKDRKQYLRPSSASSAYTRPLSAKPSYYLEKVIREPYVEPLPVFKPSYDDIDTEVAALTSITPTFKSPRPRSVSPLTYRSSFAARYGDILRPYSPYSPYYYTLLEKERALARAARLDRVYDDYYKSIDDLDIELRLARLRADRLLY